MLPRLLSPRLLSVLCEIVRERASLEAGPSGELCFYSAALSEGCSEEMAEEIDETLTVRVMRARGAI